MNCPVCGERVACGANAGGNTCWCFDWPLLPVDARLAVGACLCPRCLRAALAAAGIDLSGTVADPARQPDAGPPTD